MNDEKAHLILSNLNQRWRLLAVLESSSGRTISIATNNLSKTHPLVSKYNTNRRLHAEISCILKAKKRGLRKSTLKVWRLKKNGFGLARPCKMCEEVIKKSGVKKVFYSTNTGTLREMRLRE